jgi:hypothetical protein
MRLANAAVLLSLALACTGQFGDPSGSTGPPSSSARSFDGGTSVAADGSLPAAEASLPAGDDAASSPDSAATAPVLSEADGGETCETSKDSYGYTQCTCMPGAEATSSAVAACTGYDCCVSYAPDSGLAEGFGNPALSSNLCACYSSADIAAILGAPTACQGFAGDGTVVSSCP